MRAHRRAEVAPMRDDRERSHEHGDVACRRSDILSNVEVVYVHASEDKKRSASARNGCPCARRSRHNLPRFLWPRLYSAIIRIRARERGQEASARNGCPCARRSRHNLPRLLWSRLYSAIRVRARERGQETIRECEKRLSMCATVSS